MLYHKFLEISSVVKYSSKKVLQAAALSLVSVFALFPVATAGAAPAAGAKPVPTAPTHDSVGVTAPVAQKGSRATTRSITPLLAYTASLTASSTNLWPTQYTTLTASTNQDVGPTPYYLSVYDVTANSYIKICGSGTTCIVSVTQPTATTHTYRAYVSNYPTANPPAGQQAVSANVSVTWKGVSVSLSASPTTTTVGGTSTLTATASVDVGPTPFWIELFDATTGAFVNTCGLGTVCTAPVSQSVATTHQYVAFVSAYGTAYTPPSIQATSGKSFVTWSNTGYRVSLASSGSIFSGTRTLTATSNVNVGPTPYYIEIFNLRTGANVAICGSGTTCTATASVAFGENDFVAFVSSYSTAIPPLNTQASSNVVPVWYYLLSARP